MTNPGLYPFLGFVALFVLGCLWALFVFRGSSLTHVEFLLFGFAPPGQGAGSPLRVAGCAGFSEFAKFITNWGIRHDRGNVLVREFVGRLAVNGIRRSSIVFCPPRPGGWQPP